MKKHVSLFLVFVLLVTALVAGISFKDDTLQAADTASISVAKTAFSAGETIKVTLDSLPDTLPAKTYVILYPRSYVVGGTPNGTWVKITDDDGTHLYNEGDVIDVVKKDALTGTDFSLILVAPYASGQPLYQQIDITIGKPSLSVAKTEFTVGEAITVSYSDVTKSLLTGKSWVTIAIFKKNDIVGTHGSTAEHRVWHTDASKAQSNQASATISFPDDDNGREGANFPLPVGEYYVCIRQDNTIVGEKIAFKVVAAPTAAPTEAPTVAPTAVPTEAPTVAPTAVPTEAPTVAPTAAPTEAPSGTPVVTLSKTEFEPGEDITVTYANVEESLLVGKNWVTIAIFKKGDVIGQNASLAEHRVWHVDASKNPSELSAATITFPGDDTAREGVNFPLAEGEYYICVRQDNEAVSEIVTFTVKAKAENKPTGDASLLLTCGLVALCAGTFVVFKKRKKVEG